MKYVFFGTPSFSAHLLEKLLEGGIVPAAVVCNPDRPAGRKKVMTAPPVKVAAEAWSARMSQTIEILQPEKFDEATVTRLSSFDADIFLVFAYNKIFRHNILDIPRRGIVGIHPSFLPEYRGPSPFQTAMLDGKNETGVTLYLLDEGIDSGPIIAISKPVAISDDDTFSTLAEKLAAVGGELALRTLPDFVAGKISVQPQDESRATYTKKFITQDAFVPPDELVVATNGSDATGAKKILRKINAFNPEPGAWTTTPDGKRLKLWRAKLYGSTGQERLVLVETQKEGESRAQRNAAPPTLP